jgi:neutral amino acid transport system ATP-binding protein
MTLFETHDLQKSFGGIDALTGVDLSIDDDELVGLIGPNGAGKTTYFNCVTGSLEPTAGSVEFDGSDVTGVSPHELAQRGMVRTFQLSRSLETMTVLENVQVAAKDHPGEHVWPALRQSDEMYEVEEEVTERAQSLLDQFGLMHKMDTYASKLSGGERKILEICRGLMLEPELLLLDEPFAGVHGTAVDEIAKYITQLNDEGMGFVVIEHGLQELVQLVNRLVVLHKGRVIADGDPHDVIQNEQVINVYMGKSMTVND